MFLKQLNQSIVKECVNFYIQSANDDVEIYYRPDNRTIAYNIDKCCLLDIMN